MRPTPVWDRAACVWRVDLRTPWRLGRHVVDAPDPPGGLIEAVHAARDLLDALRAERGLSDPQLFLPATVARTLADAIHARLAEQVWGSAGGERWTRETCRLLLHELGHVPLDGFDAKTLWAYRDAIRARVGVKAMQSRLVVLQQILRWSSEPPRQWIPCVPPFPSPRLHADEVIHRALSKWIDEASFRATRARIYEHQTARNMLACDLRRAGGTGSLDEVRDVVERRRLYLSFAFYTGMRKHDLDEISDVYLSPELDCYWRYGRKTGIEVAAESICPPFLADIAAERHRLGRPWRVGELIAGGPWKNVCRVIETAATLAGVVKWNLRDARRSFVYHKALAGVPESHLVNLMGHKDSRMIHTVYLQLQPRLQRNEAGAAWPRNLSSVPGTGNARIIYLNGEGGQKG